MIRKDHEYEEQAREKAAVVPATCGASRDHPRAVCLVASELMRVIVPAPSERSKGVGSALRVVAAPPTRCIIEDS